MTYYKGSISIYFLFSIVLIVSIILSVTELSRYNCQKLYLQIANDSGLDSMASLYHRKLYDYYNIYGVEYKTDELLSDEYLSYIKPYFEEPETRKKIENWYIAKIDGTNIHLSHKELIDDKYFEKEIIEYMKYAIIGKAIEYFGRDIILEKIEDTENMVDIGKEIFNETKKSDIYSEIYNKYFNFTDEIERLESYEKKVSKEIKSINRDISDVRNISTSGELSNARSVINKIRNIETSFDNIEEAIDSFKNHMNDFRNAVNEKRAEYEMDKISSVYDFNEDITNFIESEFNKFLSFVDEDSEMNQKIVLKQYEIREIYRDFEEVTSCVSMYIDELTDIENQIKDEKRKTGEDYDSEIVKDLNNEKKELEKDFSEYIKEIRRELADIYVEEIVFDVSVGEYTEKENGLKKLISYKNNLLLNLILDDDKISAISNENIHYNSYSILSDNETISIDKILLAEYALEKFNYYQKTDITKSGSTRYEVERLISGKKSDLENIKNVISEIFKIRLAMNVLYIYKNPEMRDLARFWTSSIFFGFSKILAEAMFLLTITAWGSAQSILDLKRIMKGHKVNFMHNEESWSISLEQILDIAKDGLSDIDDYDDTATAISYKDYLRILLMVNRQSTINERMASIMENNIKKEQESFDFSKLIARFDVENEFVCNHFFTNFIFVKAKDVVLKNEYQIKTKGYRSFTK